MAIKENVRQRFEIESDNYSAWQGEIDTKVCYVSGKENYGLGSLIVTTDTIDELLDVLQAVKRRL